VEDAGDASQHFLIHPDSRRDLCLGVPGTSAVEGIQLALFGCNGDDSQAWGASAGGTDNFIFVVPKINLSLCMVRGVNTSGDSTVGLWACDAKNTNLMFESFF
jgi:hypothetical protein